MLRPVDEIAMLTRRYMHEYGATRDHLANVAMAVRKHANMNPAAIMYEKPMSREDYMASRWVSEPLCLFDNCLETDGALACVIVSAERARDLRHPPAYIHAFAQGLPPQHQTMVNFFNDDPLTGPAWACARRLWANAAFGPEDVNVAQIYDAFSPLILLSLEGYGFCKRGEAGPMSENGNLEWEKGSLPVNTAGWRALRGVRARLQPHQRRRPADAGHLHGPGGRGRDLPRDLGRRRAHERPPPAALRTTKRRTSTMSNAAAFSGGYVANRGPSEDGFLMPAVDEEGGFFWEGTLAGELRIQRAIPAGKLRHPPRPMCPSCRSTDRGLEAGRNRRARSGPSWSPTRRCSSRTRAWPPTTSSSSPSTSTPPSVRGQPRDAGPRASSNEIDPNSIRIGEPVEVVFKRFHRADGSDEALPFWVRA